MLLIKHILRNIKILKKNDIGENEEYFGEVVSYDCKTKKYLCIFDDGTPEKFSEYLSISTVISFLINDDETVPEMDD